jgi:hypothetical protein
LRIIVIYTKINILNKFFGLLIKRHHKKILITSAILAGVVLMSFSYYLWLVGGVSGYLVGKLTGGKQTGVSGRVKSIIFPINKYQFHLHHWFLAIVILIICATQGLYVITPQIFYGSMCGLAIQGIVCYNDWFHLVKKNIHHNLIPTDIS